MKSPTMIEQGGVGGEIGEVFGRYRGEKEVE